MADKIATVVRLEVPIPPSTNQLFRASGRRGKFYKARCYMAWLAEVAILIPRGKALEGLAEILIEIHGGEGWTHRRDLDNTNKAVIDMLVNKGYLHDDNTKYVRRITTSYHPPTQAKVRAICVVIVRRTQC